MSAKKRKPVKSPLKFHGGKYYLAPKLIPLMPSGYVHYVEPFFGSGATLFAMDPSDTSEIANDLNGRLMNFWRVLQDDNVFARFRRIVEAVPFSQTAWEDAHAGKFDHDDPVADASAFFVEVRQSLAGRMDTFATLSRNRTRRGMNEQASAWLSAVEGLPAVHERLKRVVVLNQPAVQVIKSQDSGKTFFYLDPPYVQKTRSVTQTYGVYEMTDEDHIELLETVLKIDGKAMISGYRHEIYDDMLDDWGRVDFDLPNNAAGGGKKRRMTECIWMNYAPPSQN